MRIAVSSSGPTLDEQVDPRFGRCAYFVVVDPSTMVFEAVENSSISAAQGAGIATAQMIAGKGVEAVLTGNCGPNAYQALEAAHVKVVTGVTGTVRDAVAAYKEGRLQSVSQANVASHHGMGVSQGRGMGAGMGGGAARSSTLMSPESPVAHYSGGTDGLLLEIRRQLDALREEVGDINRRIDELHKNH